MPRVSKTIHKAEYPVFLELLIEARKGAGLTQVQLAAKTGLSQPYVSAVERGGLRLDTLQLRAWLQACGSNLGAFGAELEDRLVMLERQRLDKKIKPSSRIKQKDKERL
ncbi:MAG TPA: helix-turn-helix transcriptional regulator [Nitrospira sp.]|nr:helix-turn-helix transcriptional regulator [Nitrospira sp.]